ncbi:MAG: acyl-CoA dehydrogenase [Desulfobacteraceae bacterium]|nr:MAG: acyl-CoA dehydrogenase [Desulfobacteraceae bacterium]
MDFSLTKEQKDIQKAARKFAQGEFDPDVALDLEKKGHYPFEIRKRACELGFIGMQIPERYGGRELGLLENVLVVEEFCCQHSGIGMALSLSDFGSEMILRFGSDDQREKYLPSITRGESALSLAYLEKDQGGDFTSFKTTASRNGNGYLINGKKSFVFNGTLSGPMIILCQLPSNIRPVEKVALIVEKDTDGLVSSPMGSRVGMRMVPMAELTFTDLKVSHECLIGNEGQGLTLLMKFLNEMNIEAAAIGTGIAQGSLNLALAYAKQREQFGRKIGSFEAIRDKLADMATKIEIARLLTYKAAWSFDRNYQNHTVNYMAKMVSAETALEVARDSLHIFGGYGYIVESKIEQFYRDASMVDIIGTPGGADKGLIADQVIGKI